MKQLELVLSSSSSKWRTRFEKKPVSIHGHHVFPQRFVLTKEFNLDCGQNCLSSPKIAYVQIRQHSAILSLYLDDLGVCVCVFVCICM